MSLIKAADLGIIACPGAEEFTNEILEHLKCIYSRKLNKRVSHLAKQYGLERQEIIRSINLTTDMFSSGTGGNGKTKGHRTPEFKVPVRFTRFANGEFKSEILSSIRGMDIYIVQDVENHYPLCFNDSDKRYSLSVNDQALLLFVTIDAAYQAGAETVTVALPAYPFSRQHIKKGREALTASWFGRTLEAMGVYRLITLDIHSKEIENTFNTLRLENLHASYQIVKKLSEIIDLQHDDIVVVAPDLGAADRNKYFAGNLRRPLALLYKERDYSKVSEDARQSNIVSMKLLGSVEGKTVFMADDMLGTGGTLLKAMRHLNELGAEHIIAAVSLPFFSGDAIKHFDQAYREGVFSRIIGTNGVYHSSNLLDREWFESVKVGNLFARIIYRLHHNQSLSTLLDNSSIIQRMLSEPSIETVLKDKSSS